MTFGSLFTGIGGLDLGLERAGLQCRWQCESQLYRRIVCCQRWPNVPRFWDIRKVCAYELPPVDLVAGGFPCQPVSVTGKHRGTADPRWIWPEFQRILRHLRPRYVLVENTPGLLGRGMGEVLGDLAGLGYDAEWQCLPAAAFGAPHLRYRLFIVAYPARLDGDPAAIATRKAHDTTFSQRSRSRWPTPNAAQPGSQRRGWDGVPRELPTTPTCNAADLGEHAQPWVFPDPTDCDPASLRTATWDADPGVLRVVHGVPGRMDRITALGDAVVPDVAEWVGSLILQHSRKVTV